MNAGLVQVSLSLVFSSVICIKVFSCICFVTGIWSDMHVLTNILITQMATFPIKEGCTTDVWYWGIFSHQDSAPMEYAIYLIFRFLMLAMAIIKSGVPKVTDSLSQLKLSPRTTLPVFRVSDAHIAYGNISNVLWPVSAIGVTYVPLAVVSLYSLAEYSAIFGPTAAISVTGQCWPLDQSGRGCLEANFEIPI